MFGILTILFIIIAATPAAFPFKAETSPQRYQVRHTNREFYDLNGEIRRKDSGYALSPQDRRYSTVDNYVKDFEKRLDMSEECIKELFCGIPIYRSVDNVHSSFIPGPEANIPHENLVVKLLNKQVEGKHRKFEIEITGSDHTTVLLDFKNETSLLKWNVGSDPENLNVKPPFVFNTFYGLETRSVIFNMEFESTLPENSQTFTITAISHYVHHESSYTVDFKEFLKSFPDWTYLNHWIVDYKSYVF